MTTKSGGEGAYDETDEERQDEDFDPLEYDTMLELERLETLEEDMTDLGVTTLDEVRRRIADLHKQIDDDE